MNQVKNRINRRAFLVAAGTTGVALPFLEGLPERSAFAQTGTANPVFGLFISAANGVQQKYNSEPESFWPTEFGPLTRESMQAFAATRATGLLADYADKLLIIGGVNLPVGSPRSCGHAEGLAQCLTAKSPSGSGNGATSTGESVDTVIASQVNPQGVSPLSTYVGVKAGFINDRLSFSGAGQVRAGEQNPYNVYNRLSGQLNPGTGTPTPMVDLVSRRRNSVNDLIREQITSLKNSPKLSQADRNRLDLHFQSIRDVEETMGGLALECSESSLDMDALTAINTGNAFRGNDNFEKVVKLHADLVGLTFSCNANRVATMQAGDGTDATQYTIDGQRRERFHHISHRINSDGNQGSAIAGAAELHAKIDRMRMETFKSILDKWSEYSTPNGPLLDNAFIYWTTHVAIGPSHSMSNMPIIIAGSGGGAFTQGAYIDGKRAQNGEVLTGILRAYGISDNFNATQALPGMLTS